MDVYFGVKKPMFPLEFISKGSGQDFQYRIPEKEPDLEEIKNQVDNGNRLVGEGVLELCAKADIAFLALHGSIGENGQLQALLDLYGIRYTGSGYAGSLLAMDKDIAKKVLHNSGILTPPWMYFNLNDDLTADDFILPCVIKPCSCGSSVGVSIVETVDELDAALEAARKYEDHILVEEKIVGREFSVGVLDGKALPPIEIIPLEGFYDYKNKYQAGLTKEVCPAEIPEELTERLKRTALEVHEALRLGFYSRVDFIVDSRNRVYCLEANTLPGMTPMSLLPQEAKVVGISYEELCEMIIKGSSDGNK